MSLGRFKRDAPSEEAWHTARRLVTGSRMVAIFDEALSHSRMGRPRLTDGYTLDAVLTSFVLCIAMGRVTTVAHAFTVLWSLNSAQLTELGVGHIVTDDNLNRLRNRALKFHAQEYDRFFRVFDRAMHLVDSSPHPRNTRETVQTRRLRQARLTMAEREALEVKEVRFRKLTTAIVGVATPNPLPAQYTGDVYIDETYVEIFASTEGRAFKKPHLIAPADADAWWLKRKKKDTGWALMHLLVFAGPAPKPYGRNMPLMVSGFHIRRRGESNADAAIAALESHMVNRWAATPGHGIILADGAYTQEYDFAIRAAEHGYRVTVTSRQRQPKNPADVIVWEPARNPGESPTDTGVRTFAGLYICPCGHHLDQFRDLLPLDDTKATDRQLSQRADTVAEIKRYAMPTNGQPRRITRPGRHQGLVAVEVLCPDAAGQIDCPLIKGPKPGPPRPRALNPPDHPYPVCEHAYSTLHLRLKQLKNMDISVRGSAEHADRFMGRTGIERVNAEIKRTDIGDLRSKSIQTMGRARFGFLAACVVTIQSMDRIEDNIDKYGSLDRMPYSPRLAAARHRAARIDRYRNQKPSRRNSSTRRPTPGVQTAERGKAASHDTPTTPTKPRRRPRSDPPTAHGFT